MPTINGEADRLVSSERVDPMNCSRVPSAYSFPRSARLLSAGDYSNVFKRSKKFTDRYWTVLVHESETGSTRLGLAIAKKRAKRAIDRNKLKRIARESFRLSQGLVAGYDMVVMNRDAAASEDSRVLREALDKILSKVARRSV